MTSRGGCFISQRRVDLPRKTAHHSQYLRMISDTNPQHWKLVFIYYNPENPKLWVNKRSGLPFTLNFARPAAWAITAVIVALAAAAFVMNN